MVSVGSLHLWGKVIGGSEGFVHPPVAHNYWREKQLESPVSFQETMFLIPSCGGYFLICLCIPLPSFFLPVGPHESQEFSLVPTDGLWDS